LQATAKTSAARPTIAGLCGELERLTRRVSAPPPPPPPPPLLPSQVQSAGGGGRAVEAAPDDQGADPGGEDQERHLCTLCVDRPRARRFDCGHMTVCEACVLQLPLQAVPQQYRTAANGWRRMKLCPTCRAPVEQGEGALADPRDSTYISPPQPLPAAAASAVPITPMHIPLPRPPPTVTAARRAQLDLEEATH